MVKRITSVAIQLDIVLMYYLYKYDNTTKHYLVELSMLFPFYSFRITNMLGKQLNNSLAQLDFKMLL